MPIDPEAVALAKWAIKFSEQTTADKRTQLRALVGAVDVFIGMTSGGVMEPPSEEVKKLAESLFYGASAQGYAAKHVLQGFLGAADGITLVWE